MTPKPELVQHEDLRRYGHLWVGCRTRWSWSNETPYCLIWNADRILLALGALKTAISLEAWGCLYTTWLQSTLDFPHSSAGKESGLIPGSGRSAGEGVGYPLQYSWASLVAQLVKNLPTMWETWVWSLGWEDPLEKGKATHSSILAWKIPWTVVHGVTKSQIWLSNFHFTSQCTFPWAHSNLRLYGSCPGG